MEREVKFIELGLEDTECLFFSINDIEYMNVEGIYEYHEIRDDDESKKINITKYCKSVHLCINKRVNEHYICFGEPSEETVFERITNCNDIVFITYFDGCKNYIDSIYVPYEERSEKEHYYDNIYQQSKINRDGNLKIIIKKKQ